MTAFMICSIHLCRYGVLLKSVQSHCTVSQEARLNDWSFLLFGAAAGTATHLVLVAEELC